MKIYQIEISNYCSLSCAYCPHRKQLRPRGYMSLCTFSKCLDVYHLCGNRNHLLLHNFGEPTLHPQLEEMIRLGRQRNVHCCFFTNGIAADGKPHPRRFWLRLRDAGLGAVDFSAHVITAEQFRETVDGTIEIRRVFDPRTRKLGTWVGQTGPAEIPVPAACVFERQDAFVVLWDGKISSCCLDVEGRPGVQHVNDLLDGQQYVFQRNRLCGGCASMRNDERL